jgi:cytochrome c oxidase assembly protein subunit 15
MPRHNAQRPRPSYRLALFGAVFSVLVIILGAFTRLVDAGLGCPDWPGCYGHILWPNEAHEIERANKAFPDAPVELDKTWPEMVHRYLASALGLVAIGLAVLALRHRGPGQPLKLPLFLLGFIILQGLFGMWTVTLKLWPQVVTAHLLGGFTTFSLFWLLALRLADRPWRVPAPLLARLRRLRGWALAGLVIVVLQVALGGWTTSNYAAVACPDLPTCQASWWPEMNFRAGFDITQHVGPNYLGGIMDNEARVAIHMAHRIGAVVTTAFLLWLCLLLWREPLPAVRRMAPVIGATLALQVALGLSNILFNFPLWVAVAHNAVGALLVVLLVTLNYYLLSAREAG